MNKNGYYRNLGSLRYGNDYCVEDAIWEKQIFWTSLVQPPSRRVQRGQKWHCTAWTDGLPLPSIRWRLPLTVLKRRDMSTCPLCMSPWPRISACPRLSDGRRGWVGGVVWRGWRQKAGVSHRADNSSGSEAARERLSSISSSLPPNEIMSLAAAEGLWSCCLKRTGECSLSEKKAIHERRESRLKLS